MTDCTKARDLANQLIEMEPLALSDQVFLKSHLESCANCQAYQENLKTLVGSLKKLTATAPPAGLEDVILATIRLEKTPAPQQGSRPWMSWKMATAAAMLLLAVSVSVLLPKTQEQPQQVAHVQAPQQDMAPLPADPMEAFVPEEEAVSEAPDEPMFPAEEPLQQAHPGSMEPVYQRPLGSTVTQQPRQQQTQQPKAASQPITLEASEQLIAQADPMPDAEILPSDDPVSMMVGF